MGISINILLKLYMCMENRNLLAKICAFIRTNKHKVKLSFAMF